MMFMLNKNFLKTFTGSIICVVIIIVVLIVIDKATASSGYSCGSKKEMYSRKLLDAKRRRNRERRNKIST